MPYPLRQAKVGQLRRLYAEVPALECKGLCQDYCGVIAMTRLEAKRIVNVIGAEAAGTSLACPLLVAGRCSVYDVRPLICRIWGTTADLVCPHGCQPARILGRDESAALIERARRISGDSPGDVACTHTPEVLEKLWGESREL